MKKNIFFLVIIFCSVIVGSCTMEKRLYRKGWYKETNVPVQRYSDRHYSENVPAENEIAGLENSKHSAEETALPAPVTATITGICSIKHSSVHCKIQPGDTARKKATYREARTAILEKGNKVHPSAMNIYNLSLIALFASIFLVPGFVLAIITLCMANAAKKKVAATGQNVNENLDIIDAGRRIAWGVIVGTTIVGIVLLVLWALLVFADSIPGG